ncbi:hypothetical protein AC579_4369 [Pseudocercospora musae]|uniref:Uncharacterized protein n=1 Tax=Pseudocercospora musae TaxID=113226 RepID=A0A139IR84_9PEZI|nr:hypothetical protein AC579_4369 [Pseudocercospora musae]
MRPPKAYAEFFIPQNPLETHDSVDSRRFYVSHSWLQHQYTPHRQACERILRTFPTSSNSSTILRAFSNQSKLTETCDQITMRTSIDSPSLG